MTRIAQAGWSIHHAVKTAPWPNDAGVEIAKLWLWRDAWSGQKELDGKPVGGISPSLEADRRVSGDAMPLAAVGGTSFQGCIVGSLGFVLDEDEANDLLAIDRRNAHVVKPYLDGAALNDSPTRTAQRWVVDFGAMSEESARSYRAPFERVSEMVRSEVLSKTGYPGWSGRWWQFWNPRPAMRKALESKERIVAIARVSRTLVPVFISPHQVIHEKVVAFSYDDAAHLGLLTSAIHWWWAISGGTTLRNASTYTPEAKFETFPQPNPQHGPAWERLESIGGRLDDFRSELMVRSSLGLTKTYNRVHDPAESDSDIVRLRQLHVELDRAVCVAYGWSDLELDHCHWETPQGVRFTVSASAKDELLDRLLELNHKRYAEEVAAGLHDKKSKKAPPKRAKAADENQESML